MSPVLYDVMESGKAHLRRRLKASELTQVRVRAELQDARYVAVLVVKDEAVRFPFLLDYYRAIGVDHFIVIDNGSTDGLDDLLSELGDVSTYRANGNYGDARYGNDWVNEVLHRHCRGKWILYVDADEFLVVGGSAASIPEVCSKLEAAGRRSLQMMMLDLYSDRITDENVVASGVDPLTVCDLYDAAGYESRYDPVSQTTWIKGGVRGRLFFADDVWAGPALNKSPLVRWRRTDAFLKSSHQLWPRSLNGVPGLPQGALLHFKFTVESASKSVDSTSTAQHTAEYQAYTQVQQVKFVSDVTTKYSGTDKLVAEGIIVPL